MKGKTRERLIFIFCLVALVCLGLRYFMLSNNAQDVSSSLQQTRQTLLSEQLLEATLKHKLSFTVKGDSKVPTGPDEPGLLREIYVASTKTGVAVSSESLQLPGQANAQNLNGNMTSSGGNTTQNAVSLSLSVGGTSSNVIEFMDKIQNLPRPAYIQNAALSFSDSGAQLTLSISLPYLP